MLALFIKRALKLLPPKIHFLLRDLLRNKTSNKLLLSKTPLYFFENFTLTDFNSIKSVNIQFKSREYLLFKYGKSWETPNKEWAYEKNDGSIVLGRKND